ncbi:MAG: alkaline phosphatase D family protein [Candidatus Phaeomarinobacter sp.]
MFTHGVASADPSSDGAILWTRATPLDRSALPLDLTVQVSVDETFESVVVEQSVSASLEQDFTIRVSVSGLDSDRWYFFRFLTTAGDVSRLGRTRTAPAPEANSPLRIALASCQNYEQGFFGAWARMVEDDAASAPEDQIHAVLHLGDFIYETTPDLPNGIQAVRRIAPFPDGGELPSGRRFAVSTTDYRHLYKAYLEDEALQAARARWPFICTWDDHEFTNDSWQSYATYTGGTGPAQRRKVSANQAWFEYIPARLDGPAHDFMPADVADTEGHEPIDGYLLNEPNNLAALASLTIYRSLEWGKTASIIVTDTRSYRAPQPMDDAFEEAIGAPAPPLDVVRSLDQCRDADNGTPPPYFEGVKGEVPNPRANEPAASVLGVAQKNWFKQTLTQSAASWKLWANSIPAMPLRLDLSSIPFQGLPDVAVGIDAWNGYPGELRELMSFVKDGGIAGVVSCAGDYHMHGAAVLTTDPDADDPQGAALEFATCAISSFTMFSGAERITREPGNAFRPMVVAEGPDGEVLENFNLTLMQGVRASLAMNYVGSDTLSGWLGNETANPFIRYLDTNAHGYVVLTVTNDEISGEVVTVASSNAEQTSSTPAEVRRRATLTAPLWKSGEAPQLSAPTFLGKPPFPFA